MRLILTTNGMRRMKTKTVQQTIEDLIIDFAENPATDIQGESPILARKIIEIVLSTINPKG